MSSIGIITNPHSKKNKNNPNRAHLLGYILGEAGVVEITESLEQLENVARQFLDNKIEILAINGGDGTISLTLSTFIRIWGDTPLPKIVLLKGGNMNVVAGHLKIKGRSPEQILSMLLESVSRSQDLGVKPLQTLKIGDNYGFLYADGVSAQILAEYYKNKKGFIYGVYLGFVLWITSLFNTAFAKRILKSWPITFTMAGRDPLKLESMGCFAATVTRLPLGMPMFGKGDDPGFFRAIAVDCERRKIHWFLPFILMGSHDGYAMTKHSYPCTSLTIEGEEPIFYTLDGELYTSEGHEVTIECGPVLQFATLNAP